MKEKSGNDPHLLLTPDQFLNSEQLYFLEAEKTISAQT